MNILGYKLYEIQFEFRTQFDKLKERKYDLTRKSWSGDPNVALELVQIDDEISKLEELNQHNLECIKEQKLVCLSNNNCYRSFLLPFMYIFRILKKLTNNQ